MVDSEFTRKILDIKALRRDFNEGMRAFQLRLDALGARWGIFAEDAFREDEKVKGVKTSLAIVSPFVEERALKDAEVVWGRDTRSQRTEVRILFSIL